MTFGEKLKQLRTSRGISQQKLADSLGMAQSSIGSYEVGSREPSFEVIQKFARYFHVPFSALMQSDEVIDDEFIYQVADALHQNPKLGLLFDKTRYLKDRDIDAVLSVVNAIARERDDEE